MQQSANGFTFNIESIKEFLKAKQKYQRINLSDKEKIEEISNRRNKIEKGLRSILKNALKQSLGRKKAAETVLSALPTSRRDALGMVDIDNILHKDKSPLYFSDLKNLINREWDTFKNIFNMEKNKCLIIIDEINEYGRPDAHAKDIDTDSFNQLRLHFKKLEDILEDWLG